MTRSRRSTCLLIALALASVGSGCGGGDGGTQGNSDGGYDGGGAGFGGSCTVVLTSSGLIFTVCTDYNSAVAAAVQQGCTSAAGSGTATSYSAGHCTATNLLGKCSIASNSTLNYYYPSTGLDNASTISASKTACANSGGVWSNP